MHHINSLHHSTHYSSTIADHISTHRYTRRYRSLTPSIGISCLVLEQKGRDNTHIDPRNNHIATSSPSKNNHITTPEIFATPVATRHGSITIMISHDPVFQKTPLSTRKTSIIMHNIEHTLNNITMSAQPWTLINQPGPPAGHSHQLSLVSHPSTPKSVCHATQ